MKPAAKARTQMAMTNAPREPLGFLMTAGMAGMTRRTFAMKPTPVPTAMVLNRPHLVSATIPPKMGMT